MRINVDFALARSFTNYFLRYYIIYEIAISEKI